MITRLEAAHHRPSPLSDLLGTPTNPTDKASTGTASADTEQQTLNADSYVVSDGEEAAA
jgi:hypothetical protein